MRDKLRKKYQHKLNKLVRELNKSIENDFLWNGRFVFHIINSNFERFEDGSGGLLYATIRGYDKKTKYYKDYGIDYVPNLSFTGFTVWKIGNRFIANDTDTWQNGNNPYKDEKIDYTKIEIDDNLWNLKYYPYKYY